MAHWEAEAPLACSCISGLGVGESQGSQIREGEKLLGRGTPGSVEPLQGPMKMFPLWLFPGMLTNWTMDYSAHRTWPQAV